MLVQRRMMIKEMQQLMVKRKLLQNLLKDDEKFALGKTYDEKLAVENSGNIDTFVRVVLTKSWQDKEAEKC